MPFTAEGSLATKHLTRGSAACHTLISPLPHTPQHITMQAEKLASLRGLFPELDNDILSAVLDSHNGDVDAAASELLGGNAANNAPANKPAPAPHQPRPAIPASQLQRPAPKPAPSDFKVLQMVTEMPFDQQARNIAGRYGLDIQLVAYEDNARYENSSWGPCISDMTLQSEGSMMPIIRAPNFTDLTWDVPIDKINLAVGNEVGGPLYKVTLREYLQNFKMYMHNPGSWRGQQTSLLASRDSHAIYSAQACFLPIRENTELSFNAAIFNYQTRPSHPAVLAIVASAAGTSAQVVYTGSDGSGQVLYFNKNGQRASFVGQRLKDNRAERGVAQEGAMSAAEKQQNVLLIIQVPLKQRRPQMQRSKLVGPGHYNAFGGAGASYAFEAAPAPPALAAAPMRRMEQMSANFDDDLGEEEKAVDVDEAIVKVGESEGVFSECRGLAIERDPGFPIRVTLQYYKATSTGAVNDEVMAAIAAQIREARKDADFIGSLVMEPRAGRPTEHNRPVQPPHRAPSPPQTMAPVWWSDWWLTYKSRLPQWTEELARDKLFSTGKFLDCPMHQCSDIIFQLLLQSRPGGGVHPHPRPHPPYHPHPFEPQPHPYPQPMPPMYPPGPGDAPIMPMIAKGMRHNEPDVIDE